MTSLRQRQGANQHVIGSQSPRLQSVAGLAHRLVARSVANNAGLNSAFFFNDGLGQRICARCRVFSQSVENVFIIVLVFRVFGIGVMARTAGEIRRHAIFVAGHGAIGNTVAVLVEIAAEFLSGFGPFVQSSGRLAVCRDQRFLVQFERLGRPHIHAQDRDPSRQRSGFGSDRRS